MKATRRVTKEDTRVSQLLTSLALQTHLDSQRGEIPIDFAYAMAGILHRAHTQLMIESGIIARRRQAHYEQRNGYWSFTKQLNAVCVGTLLILVVTAVL